MLRLQVVHDEQRRHGARELAIRVEDVLCLMRNTGFEGGVYGAAAARTRGLSDQAPGVSGWYTPPGPNLRSANTSTAAAAARVPSTAAERVGSDRRALHPGSRRRAGSGASDVRRWRPGGGTQPGPVVPAGRVGQA
jgi:hypothetical protein